MLKRLLIKTSINFSPIIIIIFLLWIKSGYLDEQTPEGKWYSFLYDDFTIQVIDQYGKPVKNAEIVILYTTPGVIPIPYGRDDTAAGKIFSDVNGLINLKIDHRALEIRYIIADGYHLDYAQQIEVLRYKNNQLSHNLFKSNLEKFDTQNPFIVKAWKFDQFPDLTKGIGRLKVPNGVARHIDFSIDRNLRCLPQGYWWSTCAEKQDCRTVYGDPLGLSACFPEQLPRKKHDWTISGSPDISVTVDFNPDDDEYNAQNWSVNIKVHDGGLIETDDLYFYKVPDEHYISEWTASFSKSKADSWRLVDRRKFYLKFNNGQRYGRLYIKIEPFNIRIRKKHPVISIEYYINEEGDKNLAHPLFYINGSNNKSSRNYPLLSSQRD